MPYEEHIWQGFVQDSGEKRLAVEKGHHVYMMASRKERISVPVHGNKDLKIGMLRSIMKIAGISEDELQGRGLSILFKTLGEVDAMRFLSQIAYEKRDYLKLQEELFEGMTVEEIYKRAKEHFEKK